MPIRFRCSYCNRLLGIATRKAGTQTTCPHCGYSITVPVPNEDESKTERINFEDVEAMLGREVTEIGDPASAAARPVAAAPVVAAPPPEKPRSEPKSAAAAVPASRPRPAPPPLPKPVPKPIDPDDPPLFEADVDELLGAKPTPEEDTRARPPVVSGMDAMSLDDGPRQVTMSAQKATLMMVVVVVLLALAFAAGMFLAPK